MNTGLLKLGIGLAVAGWSYLAGPSYLEATQGMAHSVVEGTMSPTPQEATPQDCHSTREVLTTWGTDGSVQVKDTTWWVGC